MPTPYAQHLGDRDPVDVLRSSLDDYRALMARVGPADWATPYAPGKWTLQQVMLHVAQWEMIFGVRLRCALAVPGYVIQPLDQDPFMVVEGPGVDGPTAWGAFEHMRRMNLAMAVSLSAGQRHTSVTHPERGVIDVDDLLVTLAGHGVHHFKQIAALRS